jgi:hypothetical protein
VSRAGPNAKVGRLVPNRRRRVMGFVAGPIPFNIPSGPTRRAEDSLPYLRNHPLPPFDHPRPPAPTQSLQSLAVVGSRLPLFSNHRPPPRTPQPKVVRTVLCAVPRDHPPLLPRLLLFLFLLLPSITPDPSVLGAPIFYRLLHPAPRHRPPPRTPQPKVVRTVPCAVPRNRPPLLPLPISLSRTKNQEPPHCPTDRSPPPCACHAQGSRTRTKTKNQEPRTAALPY